MALHLPTFFTRLGSAVVFSAIMMVGLLWEVWAFWALTVLIQVLCMREYFRLMRKIFPDNKPHRWMEAAVQFLGVGLMVLFGLGIADEGFYLPALLFVPTIILLGGVLGKRGSLHSTFQAFGGLFYIAVPLLLFFGLRTISIAIPLALVLMIWMNDTMAYLVGSFIGKTPFSKISPKKTWEGTIGGAILTIVGAAIWGYYSPYYKVQDWMMLALCAAIAGTAGDLLESKLKRMADVKDSGTMMPGHGGALDRFDSLLVATPFAFCYAYVFMPPLLLEIF
ncbi:MAG TPA: phosphatidate cytidylyltransferase [Flavipsychrobacter sp.]|nr:phosphatidate cytidylyltransferase [Flavipsychrobacter sp.]